MKEMRKIKLHDGIMALLMLALGVVLLVWPTTTQQVIGKVIGSGLFLFGAVQTIIILVKREWNIVSQVKFLLGIIVAVIGGWIFIQPSWILEMIPLMMGVVIMLNGLHNIIKALQLKKFSYDKWWVAVMLGVLTFILGGILISLRDAAIQTVIRVIGAFLIYDAISDLWIVFSMHTAVKKLNVVNRKGNEDTVIDVEEIEVEED